MPWTACSKAFDGILDRLRRTQLLALFESEGITPTVLAADNVQFNADAVELSEPGSLHLEHPGPDHRELAFVEVAEGERPLLA